ncbi:MAG TPA: dual specificity protein phosphatase [Ktedonobacterales bacterium]|nr:dual specificity protein phosphatase [Ktedonobacterales bacterium]
MPKVFQRARIFDFPHASELFDAHIESLREEAGARGARDIVFDLKVFRPRLPAETVMIEEQAYEAVRGEYAPMRLTFRRATWLWRTGPFERFERLSPYHEARRLFGILHQRQPGLGEFYLAATETTESGLLGWHAHGFELRPGVGEPEETEIVRRWAATPSNPTRAVPHRPSLYFRFGGDPITIHLGKRTFKHRLFIGGLHHQRAARPAVGSVLNLCGIENAWVRAAGVHPADRFVCKGEGILGMGVADLLTEARWVEERLRAGERVLVHCFAGYNRSTTVCCAALMLLEGLTAEQALERVREHHPMAWPDPYHWFTLRWIAQSRLLDGGPDAPPIVATGGAPLLRGVSSTR